MQDRIDLGCVDGDLRSKVDPRDEAQHDAEEPIQGTRSLEVVADHVTARRLKDGPCHSPDYYSGNQGMSGHLSRRERAKRGEVQSHIDDSSHEFTDGTE